MIKNSLYTIIGLFLLGQISHSQNPLTNEKEVFANAIDAEKIYLQLSGTKFNNSETIWFKAIVTDVVNHKLTSRSGVLHVELIDPLENRVIDRNLLKITNGISNGFFQLHSGLSEGNYVVRAYTEWNKNFGSDFITSVPIKVYQVQKAESKPYPIKDIVLTKNSNTNNFSLSSSINIKELDSLHKGDATLYIQWKGNKDSMVIKPNKKKSIINIQHKVPLNIPIINYRLKTNNEVFTKSVVLDEDYGSLRFFPEGGSLVEDLQSVVGFKYLNYKGKGAEITGIIEDENQVKVAEIKSNSLGMGKVVLTPKAGKTYYGVLTNKSGIVYKFPLPRAKERGQVLNLIHKEREKELRIWNHKKSNDSLFVKFFHRGKNLFLIKGRFLNGMFFFRVQSKNLPHGVIGITVYNQNFKPVSERHFFNKTQEEKLDIKVATNKKRYRVRDSVEVSLSTRWKGNPIPASVSVMAVDSSYFYGTNLERNHIISYFLLQSDIKGTIENPSYYFQNDDNLAEIDFLMLTQGWSNYKYKEKKKPRPYDAEKGLEVRGKVNRVKKSGKDDIKIKRQYELDMLFLRDPIEAYKQKTEDSGYFKFTLKDSYGYGRKFVMQFSNKRYNKEGLKIDIKKNQVPEIAYEIEKVIVPVDSLIEKKVTNKIEEDIRRNSLLLPGTIALDEIVLSNYKITPERAGMVDLHGIPDKVIEAEELSRKKKNWTKSLYKWLLFNYPQDIKVRRVYRGTGFEVASIKGVDWTYVVIDGVPVKIDDYSYIGSIPISTVKSVEILRNPEKPNKYYTDVFQCAACTPPPTSAILAIYTYSGQGLFGAFYDKKTNIVKNIAPQYTPIREYYVPEYQNPSNIDWTDPDRRTLLYWKPDIITDGNGKAKVTFFNSDLNGKMVLICEGITLDGKIGYSELVYEVNGR